LRSFSERQSPRPAYVGEIEAFLPLLRALALLRTGHPGAARALVRQTLATAIGEDWSLPPESELLALLLARQRSVHAETGARSAGAWPARRRTATAGASVVWVRLEAAMAVLLDVEQEVLFLVDGGACRTGVLAQSLRCSEMEILDLLHTARAEMLVELRQAGADGGDGLPPLPASVAEDQFSFCRHLNMALYRALERDVADPLQLEALRQMSEDEASELAPASTAVDAGRRPCLTRWLRFMYIAYAQTATLESGR
jgi:DNA-directed RNA polymerase specialized sigma24 family protein